MPDTDSLAERLVQLESAVAHLQFDLEKMHEVLLAQQAENDTLKQTLERLRGRVERMDEGTEDRDLIDERPPHY